MQESDNQYQMRGNRVAPLPFNTIKSVVNEFCAIFQLTPRRELEMAKFADALSSYNIGIDPVADEDWCFATEGHCDPSTLTIRIPQSTFLAACDGDAGALSTLFHEIGHLMLAHQVTLHNEKSAAPSMIEDAEWQADTFSDLVLAKLRISTCQQLELSLI